MITHSLPRYCHASSSKILPLVRVGQPHIRQLSLLPPRSNEQMPFFVPPFRTPIGITPRGYPVLYGNGKGKERDPGPPKDEEEVDDREWEIRSARAMLHLRNTLPRFFDAGQSTSTLFPSEVFSQNMVLKLSHPIPLKISSLGAYSMAFAIARNGMQALHSDMHTSLERMTYTPTARDVISELEPQRSIALSSRPIAPHRYKQIRVQVAVRGTVRLPPHHEAVWQTSSLYTLSPYSGLIISHQVESVRPLPGEGVAEWLKTRMLGWITAQKDHENLPNVPCPRAQAVPVRTSSPTRVLTKRMQDKGSDNRN